MWPEGVDTEIRLKCIIDNYLGHKIIKLVLSQCLRHPDRVTTHPVPLQLITMGVTTQGAVEMK
jgi:hypothetical protein